MQIDLEGKIILFYDGDCGLCNSSVQFVLKHRRLNQAVYFATLQSKFAEKILGTYKIDIKLDTLYVLSKGKIYEKSSAAIQLTKVLKFPYFLISILYIIPKFIRDWGYSKIASKRHKMMNLFCILPLEEERKFFIN